MENTNPNRGNMRTKFEKYLSRIAGGVVLAVASAGIGAYLVSGNEESVKAVPNDGTTSTYIVNDGGTLNQYFGDNNGENLRERPRNNGLSDFMSLNPLLSRLDIDGGRGKFEENKGKERPKSVKRYGIVDQVFPIDGSEENVVAKVNLDNREVSLGRKIYNLEDFIGMVGENLSDRSDPDYDALCSMMGKIEKKAGYDYQLKKRDTVGEYINLCLNNG
ncbi:MAG: hypothetical protein KC589_02120 [Nanoarchaeota archaeon]|nr:hypothetical protein [Nanoarchaeota archaeon]